MSCLGRENCRWTRVDRALILSYYCFIKYTNKENFMNTSIQPIDRSSVPVDLEGDLRSDHAGEYGAVAMYNGILATARWDVLRKFASAHLKTEAKHLALMEKIVPPTKRSRLLPIWRLSGWLLGALPALISRKAVFSTIMAVEQFVEEHYMQQINRLGTDRALSTLRSILIDCCNDEVSHKEDAGPPAATSKRQDCHPLDSRHSDRVSIGCRGCATDMNTVDQLSHRLISRSPRTLKRYAAKTGLRITLSHYLLLWTGLDTHRS